MTLIATLGVAIMDVYTARNMMIKNLLYYSDAMAKVSAYNIDNRSELVQHLNDFGGLPGLEHSCVYNKDNALIASWYAGPSHRECPEFISQTGISQSLFFLSIARQVMSEDQEYRGMIYIEGTLYGLTSVLLRIGMTALGLFVLLIVLCMIMARRTAQRISRPLRDLERRVDSLHLDETQGNAIAPHETDETDRLFNAVSRLRERLISSMVSSARAGAMRRWQEERLNSLLALLRSRLPEDSALLPIVADYSLMMQLSGYHAQQPASFNIQFVADKALASALTIQPPPSSLHVTLSIKADTPKQWLGSATMLESLLRNLMLISLRRTGRGLVCLRLEAGSDDAGDNGPELRFILEDSGPDIHPVQAERWIREARDEASLSHDALDMSWLMVSRIMHATCGTLEVVDKPERGLLLKGAFRLEAVQASLSSGHVALRHHGGESNVMPLVLAVEDDRTNRIAQRSLLEKLNCRVITVTDGAHALEWAPVLPFSLILLDQMLPDMPGTFVAEKLLRLMQQRLMPEVPVVALSSIDTAHAREAWSHTHVERLLIKPLTQEGAYRLRTLLLPFDVHFYDQSGMGTIHTMLHALRDRLPELNGQLSHHLLQLCDALQRARQPSLEIAREVHAVKSAALTLGYERLAACLNALEYHCLIKDVQFYDDNVAIIADCFRTCAPAKGNAMQMAS